VLRPASPHSGSIHAFLRAVRGTGFEGAPSPVGIDEDGRDRLEFVDGDVPVPPVTGRTVYRIVQEGITNVRKHAPGAGVEITSSGNERDGITVVISNPLGHRPSAAPGAGLGLVGLRERTELRGGRLRQRTEGSRFVLEAWLPWSA
jgi:signal transduction histidine kinase